MLDFPAHNDPHISKRTFLKRLIFLSELWKEELAQKRDTLLMNDKLAVRLEMYSEAAREGAISALRAGANTCAGADAVGDAMRGLTGNFRKLEVD